METNISREVFPETNGDPDELVEELTDVVVIDAEPHWFVMIEHTGSDRLIQISRSSRENAIALLDRIEEAFDSGVPRIRIEPDHLISLKAFRQAWVAEPEA